jgi:hypothetical protein
MKKDFQLTEKRFWFTKIKALAQAKKWDELEKFSKSKKSPIGYMVSFSSIITKSAICRSMLRGRCKKRSRKICSQSGRHLG